MDEQDNAAPLKVHHFHPK